MATTYAFPAAVDGHSAGHHAHSHSRKSAAQRMNLQATSFNAGHQANGGSTITDYLKPPMAPQHHSQKSNDIYYETHEEQNIPFPQLSSPNPSFSTPTYARTKSMERRKSAGLPTHLQLQGNGYGFPAPTAQRFRANTIEPGTKTPWITSAEAITSILIPLPYVLASMTYHYLVTSSTMQRKFEDPKASDASACGWPVVSGMTSATLVLVGFRGLFEKGYRELDRRKKSLGGDEMMAVSTTNWGATTRRVVGRILTVGLPFYATSKLGATRVALVILIGLASNIMAIEDEAADVTRVKTWRLLFNCRRWTVGSVILQMASDLAGLTNDATAMEICLGYLAIALSLFVVPPSFPISRPKVSILTSSTPASEASTSAVLPTPWETPPQLHNTSAKVLKISPLISSPEDVELTLWGGVILGLLSTLMYLFLGPRGSYMSRAQFGCTLVTSFAAAVALTTAEPRSLRNNKAIGLVLGSLLSSFALAQVGIDLWSSFVYQSIFISISFAATNHDTHSASSFSSHANQQHHRQHQHHSKPHTIETGKMSQFSEFVLRKSPNWQLLHSILIEKDSRRIFYFMCLNFLFMLVQTFYGLATGSLGLLSDSIHMFFDCIALVVGLCAAVMSKWPPSTRFPYGYGKMDTLAGFANGIFLMLISIEIIYEAMERLAEGSHINKLGELLTVSTLGLVVNLVGLLAFGHAHHGHSHGGHSHGEHSHADHDHSSHSHASHQQENEHLHHDHSHHDHSHHDHSHHDHSHPDHSHHDHCHHDHSGADSPRKHGHLPPSAHAHLDHLHDDSAELTPNSSIFLSVPATPSKPHHPDSHAHGHGSHGHGHGHHDHGHENMQGIFLHVLADTLGSAAVILSTILIYFFGWSGFDPLASCLIAILIFASAIPLVASSARTLLLTVPANTEYDLREALAGLSGLRGVVSYAVPKFWLEEGDGRKVLGVIHVLAGKAADMEDVRERCVAFLKGRNMDILVQVEREGDGRCWCKAQK